MVLQLLLMVVHLLVVAEMEVLLLEEIPTMPMEIVALMELNHKIQMMVLTIEESVDAIRIWDIVLMVVMVVLVLI